jgi:hypothetical protein
MDIKMKIESNKNSINIENLSNMEFEKVRLLLYNIFTFSGDDKSKNELSSKTIIDLMKPS